MSITAEPLAPSLLSSLLIGGIGGVIVVFTVPLLDKLKIDDVVGAIPVHLIAGIWGTIAVAFNTQAALLDDADEVVVIDGVEQTVGFVGQLMTQITGILAYGIFTFVVSLVLWFILKAVVGIRVSEEAEIEGLDKAELGMEAYPDFTKG